MGGGGQLIGRGFAPATDDIGLADALEASGSPIPGMDRAPSWAFVRTWTNVHSSQGTILLLSGFATIFFLRKTRFACSKIRSSRKSEKLKKISF